MPSSITVLVLQLAQKQRLTFLQKKFKTPHYSYAGALFKNKLDQRYQ